MKSGTPQSLGDIFTKRSQSSAMGERRASFVSGAHDKCSGCRVLNEVRSFS